MASSFPPNNTHEDYNPQGEEDAAEWLELGLGLNNTAYFTKPENGPNSLSSAFASSSSSSFQVQQNKSSGLGLGLGLGLSFNDESVSVRNGNEGVVAPPGNYGGLWEHHNNNNRDDYISSSLTLFATSPPWPAGLHDRQMPVPDVSLHHYSCRPQSGLWFTLRSTINRYGEALPQIGKAYIRVKDENVTVFMVKKYLVTKLGLSNEAEIDISCMGQNLLHSQTLKQVRDAVWLPRLFETALFENSHNSPSPLNHLMSLHYGKRCF